MEQLKSTQEALENYARICQEYCEKAKTILQNQEDPSPIATWARELNTYAAHLGEFEHMLPVAYQVTHQMAECLYNHPRLLLQLKETECEILEYVEALEGHDLQILEVLRDEIDTLSANIEAADEGRWKDITSSGHLKHDPVEWSKAYEEVIDEAEKEAYSHLTDIPRGMGFCFAYWAEKRDALAKRGIQWNSPSRMNPGVLFD